MFKYLEEGPISIDTLEIFGYNDGGGGRGGENWLDAVRCASDLLVTLAVVLRVYNATVNVTKFNLLLMQLSSSIAFIAPTVTPNAGMSRMD